MIGIGWTILVSFFCAIIGFLAGIVFYSER